MTERGKFVVLEGRDGVGKTIQVPRVADALRQRLGVQVRETREPGATPLGAIVRDLVLENEEILITPRAQLLMFAVDNAQHASEVVQPTLEQGDWVLSDRGMGSALAYQGHGCGWGSDIVRQIYGWAVADCSADATIMLDCADEVVAERKARNGEPADKIERLSSDFHVTVRDGYRQLAREDQTWRTVDASGTIPEVTALIVDAVLDAVT